MSVQTYFEMHGLEAAFMAAKDALADYDTVELLYECLSQLSPKEIRVEVPALLTCLILDRWFSCLV